MKYLARTISTKLKDLLKNQSRRVRKLRDSRLLLRVSSTFTRLHRKTSRTDLFATIAVAVLGVTLFFLARNSIESREIYYVAYVGRYSRPGFDELHVRALEKYLDELNSRSKNVILKLKPLSNHHSVAGTQEVYEQIVKDPKILAVFDNTWGKELRSVAPLIAQNGLPVISINADKGNEDFGRNVVFIGYDDEVPSKITTFAGQVLHVVNPIFIAERDYPLTDAFKAEFQKAGVDPQSCLVSEFAPGNESEQEKLFADVDRLLERWRQSHSGRPTVIVNAHGSWGLTIIAHIETHHNNVDILGGPFIIDWANYDGNFGRNERRNRLIIFTYPHDAVSNKVHSDLKEIRIDGGGPEKPNELLFVKRSLDAVSIVRGALLYHQNLAPGRPNLSRQAFIEFFHTQLAGNRYAGEYDLYVIDNELRVADERRFEQYFRDEVHSFEKQLGPENKLISTAEVGIHDVRIANIDVKSRVFHADFIVTVISDQTGLEENIYFPNAREIKHEPISTPDIKENPISKDNTPRRSVVRFKVYGDFNMDVNLRAYPLDTQQLRIQFAIKDPQVDRPRLSIGRIELEDDSLDEWKIEDYYVTKDIRMEVWPTVSAGLEDSRPEKSETLNFRIQVRRRWEGPFVTMMMPLFIIALAAIALLYIRDGSFASEGQICVGIFLALITYAFQFAQVTPRSNALTIADKMFYGTFLVVLTVFLRISFFNSSLISTSAKTWIGSRSILLGNVALISYVLMIGLILALT